MNKQFIEATTGEFVAVSSSPFPTIFNPPREYVHEVVEGESETDTSLYEPLQSVVQRCERAGMVRQLLAGAQVMRYDSQSEISDEDLENLVFSNGDMLDDVNTTVNVALDELLTVSEKASATKVAKKSKATPEASESPAEVSDVEETDNEAE